jgi:hypothetical protein
MPPLGCQGSNHNADLSPLRPRMGTAHGRCANLPEVQVGAVGRAKAQEVTGSPGA